MSTSSAANYGTISVGTTAAVLVAGRTSRRSVIIKNTHASQVLYVGDDDQVTDTNGFPVAAGDTISFDNYNGPLYGYGSGAATTGRFFQVG